MENLNDVSPNGRVHDNNANDVSHYTLMTIGIVVGMAGVILRFVTDWVHMDLIANIIFIIGTIISLKAVAAILK